MLEKTVRLLLTASILLMIAGCIFVFIGQWIYAALEGMDGQFGIDQHKGSSGFLQRAWI